MRGKERNFASRCIGLLFSSMYNTLSLKFIYYQFTDIAICILKELLYTSTVNYFEFNKAIAIMRGQSPPEHL